MKNERKNRENKIEDLENKKTEAEETTREQTREKTREQTQEQWMEMIRTIGDEQGRLSEAQDRLVEEQNYLIEAQNRLLSGQKEMKEQLRQLRWEADVKRWEEKDGSFQKGLGLGLILAPLVWAAVALLLEGFRLFACRFGSETLVLCGGLTCLGCGLFLWFNGRKESRDVPYWAEDFYEEWE